MEIDDKARQFFEEAELYNAQNDVYNAVKLYKQAIRLAPEWLEPYLRLCAIYKERREWKAILHYNKKVVALDATQQQAWWDLSIAAAYHNRIRLARTIWAKFKISEKAMRRGLVSLRLPHSGIIELVWCLALDPVRARVQTIPHPDSGFGYRDILMFDKKVVGYNVYKNQRIPIYDMLDTYKQAHFQTWSCQLDGVGENEIQLLEQLCREAGMGMEIWSNANRSQTTMPVSNSRPEFHNPSVLNNPEQDQLLVALACRYERQLKRVLRDWQVISLRQVSGLERHR